MQDLYPAKDARTGFTPLEIEGMQALALRNEKKASDCYDKVILANPTKETILRVVHQYNSAGLGKSSKANTYYALACNRQKLDDGQREYGNFYHLLNRMRKKHQKHLRLQQQKLIVQREQRQESSLRNALPPFDENITEQTALLSNAKTK